MIAYYPMFKHLHMTLALVSLLLFIYRWSLALAGSDRLQQKWLKTLPHINDTFLLLFGVLLAVALQLSPGQQPWLMAKLIALVLYIGLGVMALKRPARCQKLVAGVAALAVFGYMVGAAITKSAWSWLM
ncbi:MAG: SirB2 family protein [Aeromonas veronii]